jgi:hypothetical protein
MKKNEMPDKTNDTAKTSDPIAGLLPKLGGLLAGLSALALFFGWKEATIYYSELGAPWVTGMLSTAKLVQFSAVQISAIGIFALFSIFLITQQAATEKSLRKWSLIILFSAVLIFIVRFLPSSWFNFSPTTIYLMLTGAAFLMSIAAGVTIGELIAGLSDKKMVWGKHHFFLLQWVIGYGVLLSADINARATAEINGDLKNSNLPIVSLAMPITGKEWRLVTNIDSSFLVVSLAETKEDRVFRILNASDISSIKSTRSK